MKAAIERLHGSVISLDSSVGGGPDHDAPDIRASEVAAAAGLSLGELGALSRGEAVSAMQKGVEAVTVDYFEKRTRFTGCSASPAPALTSSARPFSDYRSVFRR